MKYTSHGFSPTSLLMNQLSAKAAPFVPEARRDCESRMGLSIAPRLVGGGLTLDSHPNTSLPAD